MCRFNGVPAEERSHWRSFLVKSGADNLKGARNEELFVASHKSVYVVYTVIGDVYLYVVGKDEYDELAWMCAKNLRVRGRFLTSMEGFALCLDEIVWKGVLENTERERENQQADKAEASHEISDLKPD
ncbi:ZETA-COAT PROTEIN [Salix purpurea]|uniref:Coatomer subunit zeta n=1 Tax=Salix purpurea TaxID=77065 RepID=A0A9Q0T240_SALPP|nr:ZETA-COAT PROTEIN [Salix purpurea]